MRHRVRASTSLLLTAALLLASLASAPAALAQSGLDENRVDFGGVDGTTEAVRAVGDQVWLGGVFDNAADADLLTVYPRANLAVFDFNTGQVLPIVADTNARVTDIESDDASTVWVSGEFTEIAGESVTRIAAFDAFSGEIKSDFSVAVDDIIKVLHYDDGWLYIGGDFTEINGLDYMKMGRVDPTTGELDTNFRPLPNGMVRSIDTFADRVYAAGFFEGIGSGPDYHPHNWAAGFDIDTGLAAGPDFAFPPLRPGEGENKAGLWEVHVSPNGDYLYTGDQRNFITKWDRVTGQKLWARESEGDIQAIMTDGPSLYIGTHDGFVVKEDQRLLVSLDTADASIDTGFEPRLDSFRGVLDLDRADGALLAAGQFTEVNGDPTPRLAIFRGPDWNGADPLPFPYVPGDVGCDRDVNVFDALLIAQFSAGLRTASATCPLLDPLTQVGPGGDVNGDGSVTVTDALIIAQCTVGLPNAFCPDE